MLKLAMFTGLRRGEIFGLQDKDLNFEHKLIRLRGPKGGKTVDLPMNPIAEEVLREQVAYKNERRPSPYVFPGRKGERRKECKAVQRIKEKAGLPEKFRIFHGLRHHYAVTLANSGEFTLDMIGELLTHKSYQMTRRYASFLPDSKQRASSRAAELLQSGIYEEEGSPAGTDDSEEQGGGVA
jgi:integrase